MVDREEGGRFFRACWIAGVHKHYPGTPKPGYIAPWESMSAWEQEIVMTLYQQARALVVAGLEPDQTACLNREQGGRVIRIGWVGQVYKHISEPKPAYVCDWEEMAAWEREVDMDIFEAIQARVYQERAQGHGQ